MPFGAEPVGPASRPALAAVEGVRFRLWAPACDRVALELMDEAWTVPMTALADGWHELVTNHARAGSRYRFVLPGGARVPDPASRFQPDDVHGPSEVTDPARWQWIDEDWKGRPWDEAVVYELHIGAFTPEGTFAAAAGRLDHLARLGVTAIQIMPVADFPGKRNWGYDGVLPYAPDTSYGGPEGLKALVQAAHGRGLMVLLDVVYNHFGPDGNYLSLYAPAFFTERHKTPWGPAVNFDGPASRPVREFVIHNALYWIEEFHLDGLRLDAVHAIADDSPVPIAQELAERVRGAVRGRQVHLILENEKNQAKYLARDASGDPRWFTAQWNDDVHHVLHTAATGESQGYYAGLCGDTRKLGGALAKGFVRHRGEPGGHLPPDAFIAFIQNHDQIGNRAQGERLGHIASCEALRAVAATCLLLPQIPMIFMGEEWSAAQPFLFFCDFGADLAEAVRKGRREEFSQTECVPDPQACETFAESKLRWEDLARPEHAEWFEWYRRILRVRRKSIVPLLPGIAGNAGRFDIVGDGAVVVHWRVGTGEGLTLAANLSDATVTGFPASAGRILWREGDAGDDGGFGPWAVRWSR